MFPPPPPDEPGLEIRTCAPLRTCRSTLTNVEPQEVGVGGEELEEEWAFEIPAAHDGLYLLRDPSQHLPGLANQKTCQKRQGQGLRRRRRGILALTLLSSRLPKVLNSQTLQLSR